MLKYEKVWLTFVKDRLNINILFCLFSFDQAHRIILTQNFQSQKSITNSKFNLAGKLYT